jgi:signal transduction histidine kinase
MQPAPTRSLWRSALFRLSILNAGLLVLAIAGAGLGSWLTTRGVVERDARERIALEAHAIAMEQVQEGTVRASEAIRARSERPGALEYLLIGPHGRVMAGDMSIAPRAPGWHMLSVGDGAAGFEGKERLLVLTQRLSDKSLLSVGDDLERGEEAREHVFKAILLSGLAALAIGLLLGFLATARAWLRMSRILAVVDAVETGNLRARIAAVRPARDDLDDLASALDGMLDRIEVLLATVRRVSAEIAHDLRTPLTRVRVLLARASGAETGPESREALEAASANIDEALRLFEAMLNLAEIDAGEAKSRFKRLDLGEITQRVADAYRADIEASGRRFTLRSDTAWAEGDADLIALAVANLIDNALKYSRAKASIDVSLKVGNGFAVLSVQDDGPGVANDDLPIMTRPFGRLDRARSSPGNGLGLAIVSAVARLHGAELIFQDVQPGLAVRLRFRVCGEPRR